MKNGSSSLITIFLLSVVIFQCFFEPLNAQVKNESSTSIIGGSDAAEGQFPWSVRVFFTTTTGLNAECMGSLYKLDWVLTAGHCVAPGYTNYRVKAGTVQFNGEGVTISALRTIQHPNYNDVTDNNDIGLIQLSSPFVASSLIRTIPISLVGPSDGEIFTTAGFGYTSNFGSRPSVLQWVQLPYIDPTTCQSLLVVGKLDSSTMICAGGTSKPPADTCNGDSGSALVRTSNPSNPVDAQVVGLTSFGTSICASGSPAVYTRVAAFYDSFIVPNAGTATTATPPTSTPPTTTPPTTTRFLKAKACKKNKNKNKSCKINGKAGTCKNKKCVV